MKGIIKTENLTKELIESVNQLIFSTKVRHYSSGTWAAAMYLCRPLIVSGKPGWVISEIKTYDHYVNNEYLGNVIPVEFELFTTDEVLDWVNYYWDYSVKSKLKEGFVEFELRDGYGYDPTRHVVNVIERYPEASEYPDDEKYNPFECLQLERYAHMYTEDEFYWEEN